MSPSTEGLERWTDSQRDGQNHGQNHGQMDRLLNSQSISWWEA